MIITKTASWELAETYHGISIYRRVVRTGTHGGNWMTTQCTVNSRRAARKLIDELSERNREVWANGERRGKGE